MLTHKCSARLHARTLPQGLALPTPRCVFPCPQVSQQRSPLVSSREDQHIAEAPCSSAARRVHTAASSSSSGQVDDSHAGRAFLHDFCMTIPYSAVALAGAAVMWFLGGAIQALAPTTAAVGVATIVTSILSLKNWKQGKEATPFTFLAAGASGYLSYAAYLKAAAGSTTWLTWPLTALSAALCLFCLYNIMAGGNPPRKGSH
mmetsp:Transcript_23263/g.59427  ORF Transcript_23263/g.59427 Transcript_23263/m.59427 type:complete len:203 (+) Transcript_23263:921-1529(+)